MKNSSAFFLAVSLLVFGGLACKINPLAKYSKQYNCSVPGETDPQTSDEYVTRAYKHIELNNHSTDFDQCAFDAAQEAVRLDPKNADALVVRGGLFLQKPDTDAALKDFSDAINLKPGIARFYVQRSLAYEKKLWYKQAIEDMSVALKTENSHSYLARRGSLYFAAEEFENALKDYTEAIRQKPDNESYYAMRAEIYRKLGRSAEAEADELKAESFEEKTVEMTDSSTPVKSDSKTISGGVLNGKATNLVKPAYPPAAKTVRASGAVNVQVTIDESGNVISANAVSGHPLLRASAVQAARASKFSPTLLSGKPVKVTGVIVYNFTPE